MLVGEGEVMKIADYGLARNVTQNDYYRKTTNVSTCTCTYLYMICRGSCGKTAKLYEQVLQADTCVKLSLCLLSAPFSCPFATNNFYQAFNAHNYASPVCLHQQGLLPVKWMAPEAMFDGKYDMKSDV